MSQPLENIFFDGGFLFSLFGEIMHFEQSSTMEKDSSIKRFELWKIKDIHIMDLLKSIVGL